MRELIGDYDEFVANINWGLDEMGVDRDDLVMMDHLCYRVETERRYSELRRAFGRTAQLLGESVVSGRLIATFEFPEPLETCGWKIPYLELPEPKKGSPYHEGLEHAELVTAGSLDWFQRRYPLLPFTHNGMDKPLNPELGLKHAGISVKFHEQPLGAVVRAEKALGLTKNP